MPTALITGASSGIGEAFAREYARRQTDLVLVARSEEKLNALATELGAGSKIQTHVIVKDLTASAATTEVFDEVNQRGLAIDTLVNNAGFGDYGAFVEGDRAKQLSMVQLNVTALMDLTYLFLPQMQQRGSGNILNIASTAGFLPLPYMSVYGATKAFVLSFSEALWAENQETGVNVLAVCPGPTKTSFFQVAGFGESANPENSSQAATPETVVSEAFKALQEGKASVVTGGIVNQIVTTVPRFFPRETLLGLVKKQFQQLK